MLTLLTAIVAFFAFGAWGFWLGLLFLSVVYTIATESDVHGLAIFATIMASVTYWAGCAMNVAGFTFIGFPALFMLIGGYALIGGIWSVWRWFKYCREYIAEHPFASANDHDKYDYEDGNKVMLTPTQYYTKKLRPSEHKSRLIGWIAYWPWSLVWNVVGDALTAMYDALVNIYNRTAQAVIKKALGNFGKY